MNDVDTAGRDGARAPLPAAAPDLLAAVEAGLDPARPERSGLTILAYGEVSCAMIVPGLDGWVAKRMAGLRDDQAAAAYLDLLAGYLADLRAADVEPVETHAVLVRRGGRGPVVYLLQPRLDAATLGSSLLREADDDVVAESIRLVLDQVLRLHVADRARPGGEQVAIDAQLSNWSFAGLAAGAPSSPVLLDVGTPFVRRAGRHALDTEIFLSAVPAALRGHYRRTGEVEAYLDDYFVPRLVAVDLLGNLHKEGRPDRVPLGLAVVNAWLAGSAEILDDSAPVSASEVADYYAHDADQLALFLRVRRADRMLQRLAGRRYDFVLPGSIRR